MGDRSKGLSLAMCGGHNRVFWIWCMHISNERGKGYTRWDGSANIFYPDILLWNWPYFSRNKRKMRKLEIFYYSNCGKSVCFETQMFLEKKGYRSSLLIKISLCSLYNLAKWDRASRNWLKNLDRRWCVEGIGITISSDNDREAGQASEKKSKRRQRENL